MFNPSEIVIEAFVEDLVHHYINMYGENEEHIQLISGNARNALEIIANSDAPYHDVNHTIMVTSVGTEILRGKVLIEGGVTANESELSSNPRARSARLRVLERRSEAPRSAA